MGFGCCWRACPRPHDKILMKCIRLVWPSIQRRIQANASRLLILDFDGTLVYIRKHPESVVLGRKVMEALVTLSQSPVYKVAIVSGRSLADLKKYFNSSNVPSQRIHRNSLAHPDCRNISARKSNTISGLKFNNIVLVGNHGLELRATKLSLPQRAKKARKLEALIWLLGKKLKKGLSRVPGVMIEDKNYTLSLHYRNISKEHLPFFNQEIVRFKKRYAHWPLVWRAGKKVWEVRPGVQWDKGDMALLLAKKFPKALPIVIGDDLTDEDMFRAIKNRGLTIRVRQSHKSAASYYLESPVEVRKFLEKLCQL